jgi:hypothetical protein
MLLQTVLFLTSVLSAIALIALILIQDRPGARLAAPAALQRATAVAAALFVTSSLAIAVADGVLGGRGTSGSLLDGLAPRGGSHTVQAQTVPVQTVPAGDASR